MPEFYGTDNGQRVINRHQGAPGQGIPVGGTTGQILVKDSSTDYDTHWANPPNGTDAVVGPASAVDNRIATFNGITGKLIKDSGTLIADLATVSLVDSKQDAEAGKGLSTNDFTDLYKAKLETLSLGGFRGVFPDIETINENTFDPVAQQGDYCYIEEEDETLIEVLWDSTNLEWVPQTLDPVAMTGSEIATALFNTDDAAVYDKEACRIFTSTEKGQVAAHEAFIGSIGTVVAGTQPLDATLTALAGLVNAADQLPYFNNVDSMAATPFTGAGRTLVGCVTTAAQRTALELGLTDDAVFRSVQTEAPVGGTAKPMKFGEVFAITDAAMLALGFAGQQQIDVDGTSYWVPLKTSPWT